ncbi:MBL fold metallo-hydrolase [Williamsia sp. CHRR-6]|uniref:MBL fold metallo-hydrolase n=1 Tax=Williamsia sp. CHRR-6 TaxID=2835871 RepID=UPI001BDA0AB3|nr:MBL fold metallo-hydrolase [Williamsia sp. CHRR-6]MBT0565174.1 MBL fold metallo-hydrolase [Williamsia sp. CHRR-6]
MTSSAVEISDHYTGDLSSGARVQRLHTDHASIAKMSVGPMDNNVYVVTCTATGDQLLIDAANDGPDILAALDQLPGQLRMILTTHQHHDHWQALSEVAAATEVPTAAGRVDAAGIDVGTDRLISDGEQVRVGDLTLTAIELVGHTPGSIALVLRDGDSTHLFSGDCLFPGGVGKTWQPGDFETLLDDVESKVFAALPDSTVVHPGHGLDTTLGAERPHLPQWRERGW